MRSGTKGILCCQSIICQLVINLNCFIYQGSLDISCFLFGNMVQRFQTEYCFMLIMIKTLCSFDKACYRLFIQTNEWYWLLDAERRSWCIPVVQHITRNPFSLDKQERPSSKGFWMMIPFPEFSLETSEKGQWQRERRTLAKYISYQRDLLGSACSEGTVGSAVISHQTAQTLRAIPSAQAFCCSVFRHLFQCLSSPCFKQMHCRCLVGDRGLAKAGRVASEWPRRSYGGYYWEVLDGPWALNIKQGVTLPTPFPPLNVLFCPSGFRVWWRTGIRMHTEMQPTQTRGLSPLRRFIIDIQLKVFAQLLLLLLLLIWHKTGHGGTWCVVKIAASETRLWPENNRKATSLG